MQNNMKKLLVIAVAIGFGFATFAQEAPKKEGKKEAKKEMKQEEKKEMKEKKEVKKEEHKAAQTTMPAHKK
jgi:Ni/Co efflux regulator RcnB